MCFLPFYTLNLLPHILKNGENRLFSFLFHGNLLLVMPDNVKKISIDYWKVHPLKHVRAESYAQRESRKVGKFSLR